MVYLPAGYGDGNTYPVWYGLHGYSSTETMWLTTAGIGQTADAMGIEVVVELPEAEGDGIDVKSGRPVPRDEVLGVVAHEMESAVVDMAAARCRIRELEQENRELKRRMAGS